MFSTDNRDFKTFQPIFAIFDHAYTNLKTREILVTLTRHYCVIENTSQRTGIGPRGIS